MQNAGQNVGFLVKRDRIENSQISFKLSGKIGPQKNHIEMRDTVNKTGQQENLKLGLSLVTVGE